jgi:hypothetical protein
VKQLPAAVSVMKKGIVNSPACQGKSRCKKTGRYGYLQLPAVSRAQPSAGVKSISKAGNHAFASHGDELTRGYVCDEQSEGIGADVYCSSPDHKTMKA